MIASFIPRPQWVVDLINELSGEGVGGVWGSITGTLSSQTDLQAELDALQTAIDAAGSSWALVSSTTISTPVAQVDVIGLAAYSDLLIIGQDITTSSTGIRQIFLSTNNGVSFYTTSGDYVGISADGTANAVTQAAAHTTNSTATRTLVATINGTNIANAPKMVTHSGSTAPRLFVADNANNVDAIRFNSSAGNLTGGAIYVFAR